MNALKERVEGLLALRVSDHVRSDVYRLSGYIGPAAHPAGSESRPNIVHRALMADSASPADACGHGLHAGCLGI